MDGIDHRRPPLIAEVVERRRWAVAEAGEVARVRRDLRHWIGATEPDVGDAVRPVQPWLTVSESLCLVATELITNAIRHGGPPSQVTVDRGPAGYLIDVTDSAVADGPRVGEPAADDFGGRGLRLVIDLSTRRGWYVDDSGKHVWALVPTGVPESEPASQRPGGQDGRRRRPC